MPHANPVKKNWKPPDTLTKLKWVQLLKWYSSDKMVSILEELTITKIQHLKEKWWQCLTLQISWQKTTQ